MTLPPISLDELRFLGSGLRRPESVSVTQDGTLYACDARGGICQICPDGNTTLIGRSRNADQGFIPNGFCLMPDGNFLVANIGSSGGIWLLDRAGNINPWLMSIEEMPLGMPNFVFRDWEGTIWISALPNRMPPVFAPGKFEGFIARVDATGAKIVARDIDIPNEIRIDPIRKLAYTNETFLGRMLQFRINDDGVLVDRRVLAQFDPSDSLDGLEVDSEGYIWTTSIIVNRLYRIHPETGACSKLLENCDAAWVARLVDAKENGEISRAVLYEENSLALKNISSIAFGGPDLKTVFLGSMAGSSIPYFTTSVAGIRPPHWDY